LGIGVAILLVLPKLVTPEQFGNWQMYQLFAVYLGYLTFGYTDGVFLRWGGATYDSLPRGTLSAGLVYQLIANTACAMIAYGVLFSLTFEHRELLIAAIAGSVFYVSRTLVTVVLQVTGHSKDYAVATVAERVILLAGLGVLVATDGLVIETLVWFDVAGRALGLGLALYLGRAVFLHRPAINAQTLKTYLQDCGAGVFVLVANLSAIAINGVVRLAIETKWGIVAFGEVSLSFQLLTFVLVLVNSVALSLFPHLKRLPTQDYATAYQRYRSRLVPPLVLALGLYFPLAAGLMAWLPDYAAAARYLAILFPLCIYETTSRALSAVFLKALRQEKALMAINLGALALAVALAVVILAWVQRIDVAVLSIVVALALRAIAAEALLARRLTITLWPKIVTELFMTTLFLVCAFTASGAQWPVFVVYAALAAYAVGNRQYLRPPPMRRPGSDS
jgi:O-antigen/teichoic acid export membrane protein